MQKQTTRGVRLDLNIIVGLNCSTNNHKSNGLLYSSSVTIFSFINSLFFLIHQIYSQIYSHIQLPL